MNLSAGSCEVRISIRLAGGEPGEREADMSVKVKRRRGGGTHGREAMAISGR